MGNGIMCLGNPTIRLRVGERDMAFEMHHFCGPMRVNTRTDEPTKNQWSENSPFWPVFTKWMDQGQQVVDGRGVMT